MGTLNLFERLLFLVVSLGLIAPTVAGVWIPSLILFFTLVCWRVFKNRSQRTAAV
jgi:hypothetical protein